MWRGGGTRLDVMAFGATRSHCGNFLNKSPDVSMFKNHALSRTVPLSLWRSHNAVIRRILVTNVQVRLIRQGNMIGGSSVEFLVAQWPCGRQQLVRTGEKRATYLQGLHHWLCWSRPYLARHFFMLLPAQKHEVLEHEIVSDERSHALFMLTPIHHRLQAYNFKNLIRIHWVRNSYSITISIKVC